MTIATISAVLEAAGTIARGGLVSAVSVRARIQAALDAYVAADEARAATALAERLGLPRPAAPDPASAARALLDEVRAIPELGSSAETEEQSCLPSPTLHDAEADALWAEAHELGDMEECWDDHFRCVAEELAARARVVQERLGDRGRDAPECRVIRKLTALSSQRGIHDIRGLKRRQTGNWREQAKIARRERQKFEGGIRPRTSPARPQQREEAPDDPVSPLHRLAASGRPVVIVGGEADPQKLSRLRRRTAVDLEWVGVDDAASLDRRIAGGHVAAVVVLDALVGHSEIEAILRRARAAAVPLEYGGKAGLASIQAALELLEARVGAVAA